MDVDGYLRAERIQKGSDARLGVGGRWGWLSWTKRVSAGSPAVTLRRLGTSLASRPFVNTRNHQSSTSTHNIHLTLLRPVLMATHHTTPLRRISHGSLSQSHQASTSSPTQLDFLAQPLADLVDEIDALHQNLININALSDSLGAFNEGFATFLYGMRMNAFSVEWPQASPLRSLRRELTLPVLPALGLGLGLASSLPASPTLALGRHRH